MVTRFSTRILNWYAYHARDLPWRRLKDPYAVWVSEIMLQQTRVTTVIPYFARWMERFPDVATLAAASEGEVLSTWEGLGYYSRARHLHAAAQVVMAEHGGRLPRDPDGLRNLPGIGKYTARAIASIAFGMDLATLDGNIKRVLARVFNVVVPADTSRGEKALWELVESHLPAGRAGDFNQALMDLGALICLPKKPECAICPLKTICQANLLGLQEQRPVLKPGVEVPHFVVTAAVIRRNGRVLVAKRPSQGLLGGMWEFPGGKVEKGESLAECLRREIREELGVEISVGKESGIYRHAYTHFRITLHAFECDLVAGKPAALQVAEVKWVLPADLEKYPMGKVDRLIARGLRSNGD